MRNASSSGRRHPTKSVRPRRPRLLVEFLEDRILPSNGEWLVRLQGLPGATTVEQMQAAAQLFHAAQIRDEDILVVDHNGIDGNVVVQAPLDATEELLTHELTGVPGFLDVVDFEGEDDGGVDPDQPAELPEGPAGRT